MFNLDDYEDAEATSIGLVSLVGVRKTNFPLSHGNYFSVETEDSDYEIVNMWYENLEHLIELGEVQFPIKIKILNNRCAIIFDERVNPKYLCEISYRAPQEFWSLTQLTKRQLDINSGRLKISKTSNGMIVESYPSIETKNKSLKMKWKGSSDIGPAYINAPFRSEHIDE